MLSFKRSVICRGGGGGGGGAMGNHSFMGLYHTRVRLLYTMSHSQFPMHKSLGTCQLYIMSSSQVHMSS